MNIEQELAYYLEKLFPIARSVTGPGNRETLKVLQEIAPIEIHEIPSGTNCYDWVVPREWTILDAYIENEDGIKLIDFNESNLHIVSYSQPIDRVLTFEMLEPHLHKHPTIPDAIPYRTSYYKDSWGFCVTHEQYHELRKYKKLHVVINSEFDENGSMTYGEMLIPGSVRNEILVSTYICHPSLANDNLSGFLLTAFIARYLLSIQESLKHSYRIVWLPETIGAIAYCHKHEYEIKKIKDGIVITTVGGPGSFGYKMSFERDADLNYIAEECFSNLNIEYKKYPFNVMGSDERQFSSIGFGVNMVSITKDKYYEYEYYHTSLDDLNFVNAYNLKNSYQVYQEFLRLIDSNLFYLNVNPNCEVMLSKHGLYPALGGGSLPGNECLNEVEIILWLLFLADGQRSLYEMSKKIGCPYSKLIGYADLLSEKGLFEIYEKK